MYISFYACSCSVASCSVLWPPGIQCRAPVRNNAACVALTKLSLLRARRQTLSARYAKASNYFVFRVETLLLVYHLYMGHCLTWFIVHLVGAPATTFGEPKRRVELCTAGSITVWHALLFASRTSSYQHEGTLHDIIIHEAVALACSTTQNNKSCCGQDLYWYHTV